MARESSGGELFAAIEALNQLTPGRASLSVIVHLLHILKPHVTDTHNGKQFGVPADSEIFILGMGRVASLITNPSGGN